MLPITEKNPFTPHEYATRYAELSFSNGIDLKPYGKGIPIKKDRGAINATDIRTRQIIPDLSKNSNNKGLIKPITVIKDAIMMKIIIVLFLSSLMILVEAKLPSPEKISIVDITVSRVYTG